MKYKGLLMFIIAILLISGCSKDTNKAKINDSMFNAGKDVVHLYGQAYNGDESKESKAWDSASRFLKKYDLDTYSFPSVKDEIFAIKISLLQIKYSTYIVQKVNDELSGSSESDGTKEEIKNLLLKFKNTFGIYLE